MSDSNGDQQEPSMEEILASIRRIISEDDEEAGAEASGAASDEDVLELTDVVDSGEPEGGPGCGPGCGEDAPGGGDERESVGEGRREYVRGDVGGGRVVKNKNRQNRDLK